MKDAIRAWGWRTEFLFVALVAFGPFISRSLWVALHHEVA